MLKKNASVKATSGEDQIEVKITVRTKGLTRGEIDHLASSMAKTVMLGLDDLPFTNFEAVRAKVKI
jgi:hypothetical protein